jgi:hypothetical protein
MWRGKRMPIGAAIEKDNKLAKEIRQIRNLLILIVLKSGATSDEVHYATGMGAANIRHMFPVKRGRRKGGAQ